ncbi:carbon-nitrogen hydrolase family protein [Empedobacter sedimenti]|uniref:carbon-nitrogen hydrolase family protein n=1 Tax=Empedobacter sedimenti TaxID=3042610 RepID=UPI0024A70485|nr:carbon-nitrogen hydrolase family protein [Empedobacter sedimenti]
MKVSVAQINPIKGDIESSINHHLKFIRKATEHNVELIVFPELSLTGYEPELAKNLALNVNDKRLNVFQKYSDENNLTIGIGSPTFNNGFIFISMIILQPFKERLVYSKTNLFHSELDIFSPGSDNLVVHFENGENFTPAICYDISDPEHSFIAKNNNTSLYIASVLNSISGVDDDLKKLSHIAKNNQMNVMMANYIGQSGGYNCAGKSSVWNNKGQLIMQMNNTDEGLIIYDTNTEEGNIIIC